MEQIQDKQLKCSIHKEELISYVCIDTNCKESSRLLCGDCAMFIPHHKDHINNIVKLKNIQQSNDGSSLQRLKNIILSSSPMSSKCENIDVRNLMSPKQVNLFFDLIEQQIIGEIARVRKRVLCLIEQQDNLVSDINEQIISLESNITNLFEKIQSPLNNNQSMNQEEQEDDFLKYSKDTHKSLKDLTSQDMKVFTSNNNFLDTFSNSFTNLNNIDWQNQPLTPELNKNTVRLSPNQIMSQPNQQNDIFLQPNKSQQDSQNFMTTYQNIGNECDISREISYLLNKISENTQEQIFEYDILMKQQLKKCELNLNCFSDDIKSFLSSYLPHKQLNEFSSISKMLDSRFGFEITNGQLQLLDPAEFYQGMGIKHCIAINSTSNLPLLRRASTLICHQSGDEDDIQQNSQQGIKIPQFVETQRSYLFSVFFDCKSLNDLSLKQLSDDISKLSYIENIHLDFDGNMISSQGYISLFKSLQQFNSLKHIDLRFNNNHTFDEESISLFTDVLNTHKSTLRALCLTMRSLRSRKIQNSTLQINSTSTPNSPCHQSLNSSSESFDNSLSSSSTYFYSADHPENLYKNSSNLNDHLFNSSNFTFADSLRILFETIGNLSNLEVLYLDISHNKINQVSRQEIFAPIFTLKKLEMLYFVFNKTNLPYEETLDIVKNINSKNKVLKYFKLFLKENNYTFQQQRSISGQFQKIQAKTKNFDLFY